MNKSKDELISIIEDVRFFFFDGPGFRFIICGFASLEESSNFLKGISKEILA